jgi:hypothetical protein
MWSIKMLALLTCFFTVVDNGYSLQKINLSKVSDLSPLLEKNNIFQPTSILSDRKGNFYIFDNASKSIYKFSASFGLLRKFGQKGQGPGEFSQSVGKLLLSPDDKLVVLENRRKTIHYFDLDGKFLESFLIDEVGTPYDLAIDRNGNHYFTDLGFYINRYHVLTFNRNGNLKAMNLPDEYFMTWGEATKKGTPYEQTERIAQLMAQHHRKIEIGRNDEIYIGRFDKYIFEKYSKDFKLLWRKEMKFERKVLPHAGYYRRGTMPEALNSAEGDGAIADMELDERNNIFISVGVEKSFDDSDDGHLRHWIDVFDHDGNHLARLLENELPHNQRGYQIDIHGNRLIVLGEDRLLTYNIEYH